MTERRSRARRVPTVDIGDGLKIPERVEVRARTAGYVAHLTAVYDPTTARYRTTSLTFEANDGHEVTGESLRAVKVAEMLRLGVESALTPCLAPQATGRWPEDIVAAGPTTETLRYVATIYRQAVLLGDPPTNAVAEELGIPRSTAGRWVTRARDRGFLTVVDRHAARMES